MHLKHLSLILSMVLGLVLPARASKLKAILIIQDDARHHPVSLYKDCVQSDLALVQDWLTFIEDHNIMKVETRILRGKKTSLRSIESELRWGSVGKDDVWMLYWSGTGGMTNGEPFLYTHDEKIILLKDIHNIAREKKARLKLLITDPKTDIIARLDHTQILSEGGSFPQLESRIYSHKTLLQEYEGTLILNSHAEGEKSWGGPQGSMFSQILFDNILLDYPLLQWESIYEKSREWSYYRFNRLKYHKILDKKDLSELLSAGLNGQHPRLYSMAGYISNKNRLNLTNTQSSSRVKYELTLNNPTDQTLKLYWDKNLPNKQDIWSAEETETISIPAFRSHSLSHYSPEFILYNDLYSGHMCKLYTGNYTLIKNTQNDLSTIDHSGIDLHSHHILEGTWKFRSLDHPDIRDNSFAFFQFRQDNVLVLLDKEQKELYRGHWFMSYLPNGKQVIELDYRGKYRKRKVFVEVNPYRKDAVIFSELKVRQEEWVKEDGLLFLQRVSQLRPQETSHSYLSPKEISHHESQQAFHPRHAGFKEYYADRILTGFQLSFSNSLVGIQALYRINDTEDLPGPYSVGQYFGIRGDKDIIADIEGYRMAEIQILTTDKNSSSAILALKISWKKWDPRVYGPQEVTRYYGNKQKGHWYKLRLDASHNMGVFGYLGPDIRGLGILSKKIPEKNNGR